MTSEKQTISRIEDAKIDEKKISNLPTRPNSKGLYGDKTYSAQELKERLEALSLLAINKLNEIIGGMAAGGAVAETIKFKHGEEEKEYSLAELFSMIFEANGLSDILKTNFAITVNGASKLATLNTALGHISSFLNSGCVTNAQMSFSDGGRLTISLQADNGEILSDEYFDIIATTKTIANGAVTTDKLAGGAVTTEKLADKSVTREKIADRVVAEAKLTINVADKLNSAYKDVSYNSENGRLTFVDNLGNEKTINLPLELFVSGGEYDKTENKEAIVLTLANGEKIRIPVNDLIDTIDNRFGDVEEALDAIISEQEAIIAIQENLIGGDSE